MLSRHGSQIKICRPNGSPKKEWVAGAASVLYTVGNPTLPQDGHPPYNVRCLSHALSCKLSALRQTASLPSAGRQPHLNLPTRLGKTIESRQLIPKKT